MPAMKRRTPTPSPPRDPAWLDREYNARAAIDDSAGIIARWADEAASVRRRAAVLCDIAYGETPAERLDFFPAAAQEAPLFVFLHGGYWRSLDKSYFSWVAPPLVAAGVSVAIPNYALVPSVTMQTIVRQALAAHAWLYRHASRYDFDRRRIVSGGHSAGGHLAAMMLCARWKRWGADLPQRLVRAGLSISGLHDLAPVAAAPFLAGDLRLDAAAARRLSPATMPPTTGARLLAVVGQLESGEFHRQANVLAAAWPAGTVEVLEVPGRHHLSVLEALAERGHRLHAAALALCAGTSP
jgi:arylformamidase